MKVLQTSISISVGVARVGAFNMEKAFYEYCAFHHQTLLTCLYSTTAATGAANNGMTIKLPTGGRHLAPLFIAAVLQNGFLQR